MIDTKSEIAGHPDNMSQLLVGSNKIINRNNVQTPQC